MVWTGFRPLEIITDVSYTVKGFHAMDRRRLRQGKISFDIWSLIYDQLDSERCRPALNKVKPHITTGHMLHRRTPQAHISLNELADAEALQATDHQGVWGAERAKAQANVKLFRQACRRISYVKAYIRESSGDHPITTSDIINSVEYEVAIRRTNATDKGKERTDKLISDQGRLLVRGDDIDRRCCQRCGGSALGRSSKYWRRRDCNITNDLSTPVETSNQVYTKLDSEETSSQAHVCIDAGIGAPASAQATANPPTKVLGHHPRGSVLQISGCKEPIRFCVGFPHHDSTAQCNVPPEPGVTPQPPPGAARRESWVDVLIRAEAALPQPASQEPPAGPHPATPHASQAASSSPAPGPDQRPAPAQEASLPRL